MVKPFFIINLILFGCFFISWVDSEVLNPPYFNLAEGRNIKASATCGENVPEPELYCKIVGSNWLDDETDNINLIEGQACDYCDPHDPRRAHPPQYAIDGSERWWQSPPLSRGADYSKINLTLELGQEFHVAYVFIKMGNSPRPGVWILERSRDYGESFTPWQYFADTPQDCSHFFGKHTLQPITRDDSVICETKFSKLVPLENGEIAVSLINGRPSADNFSMSATLQDWTTATDIRLRFLRPKTTLGHLLSVAREEPTVTRRYFYSVKDINVGGQCVCNGHASQCDQGSRIDPLKLSCKCDHNTDGLQCEKCAEGYNQYKWRRATIDDPFVCEKCNCHGHSNNCYFDEEVASKNLSKNINGVYLGGGVCTDCQHNTTGYNCDKCKDGYYRPKDKSLDAIDVCQACQCDLNFSTGNCEDETGQCECKKNYKSPDCDQCSIGYFGYPECEECHCFPNGTLGDLCELKEGDCPCKQGYGGKYCKQCVEGYFGFPDCQPCNCNPVNSLDSICNIENGQCKCQSNFGNLTCNECNVGFYRYPKCESCYCTKEGTTKDVCDAETGECFCKEGFEKPYCNKCAEGYFGFPNCVKCDCNPDGSVSTSCDQNGKCQCKENFGGSKCGDCGVGFYNYPKCEQCKCHWAGSSGRTCDHSGNCFCSDHFEGQKCDQCKEGYYNFPICEECNCNPAGLVAEFGGCDKVAVGKLCECKERVKGRICNQCKDLYWNLQMNNPFGCEECFCNKNGTISGIGICDTATGQCMCKTNVHGRTCNVCKPNTYRLDSANLFGCVDCQCDIGGAISTDCDKNTGQCRCKSRIKGKTCSETLEAAYFPSFYQFKFETEDWNNPTGSQARFGYDENIFPNHSWRGYAIFSPLQKEIFTNVTITKTSIYKVIVHYVSKNNEVVNGLLKFMPPEWINEEEQSVSIAFEPSSEPKLLYVTGRQMNGMISLGVGPWQVSLQVDKPMDLFVDYIVLIPQAYYDPSLFQEGKTGPCLYYPTNNLSCILYSYPKYPNEAKVYPATDAYVIKEEAGQVKPKIVELENYNEKLKEEAKFIEMNEENPNLEFDFTTENNGSNLIVINYHTPNILDRNIPIKIQLENLNKNQTIESENILSACPYKFACRKAITTDEGRLLTFDSAIDDPFRLRIELPPAPNSIETRQQRDVNDTKENSLNLNTVNVIPFDNKWSVNYIKHNFECMYKNDSCQTSTFPPVTEGLKLEAEVNQKPEQVVELPIYKHTHPNSESTPALVQLNDSMKSIDIRGSVPKPGQYYFILHYYHPDSPNVNVDALIQNGHLYSGETNLEHCPNVAGCRVVLKQRDSDLNSTAFTIQKNFLATFSIPKDENVYLDYLLLVPAENFEEHSLNSEQVSNSKNIMTECIKNNYYIDPNDTTDFCRSLVFSTTVDFNGGALPCNCNIDGSFDHKCQNFGGQCKCKPNVIGRDCSKCKTGYYGWPNCKKCDCPSTAICHEITGSCICPKGVTGKDCDTCLPLTFGFDKIIGCVDCACDPNGVLNRDLKCDIETGDCNCKQNIVGRTCNKCKPGFSRFPQCQLCQCDIRGTTPEICDQNSARCYCKKNVDGALCDRCKPDSYYLEENNEHGCTKCFCFGNTDRCISSSFVFVPITFTNTELEMYNISINDSIIDMNRMKKNEDYELDYSVDKFLIRTSFPKENIEIPNSEQEKGIYGVYISLPKEYLGNKIGSYGGDLEYNVVNKINNTHESAPVMDDIILIGNNYTLVHNNPEEPAVNEKFSVSIKLVESEFTLLDGSPITREQLMMTLVDLHAIYVRVKYFDSTQDTIDIEFQVQMETSVALNKFGDAKPKKARSVEQCHCPPNYRGTSCELCADGYYRVQQGPYLGACIPCDCNGHSNECDPITGQCFNCKFNTEGDHCERCTDGFYGDATQGTPNDCLICACPLPTESNNFATKCEVSSSGSVLSCDCKEGYNGTRCEVCGAGHYGQPLQINDSCKKCECNNNIDITDADSCNPYTGMCTKCLFNSSGPHCERCADWHYGDSIVQKNCTECTCNQCGSEYCDHKTSICKCKPNVIGKNCDECAPGFYGFSTCNGCQPCNCGEASHDLNCDDTGQCPCKTGVTGKTCSTCAPGFWGYSKYGCTSCGCDEKYSRVKQCNQFTGKCQCLPDVIGAKCEKCPDRWVLIPETGCQECGECIHTLLDDAEQIQDDIKSIDSQTQNTSSSVLAYRKLDSVQEKMKLYSDLINKTFEDTEERRNTIQNFTKVKDDSSDLMDNFEKLDTNSDALEKESAKILSKVNKAYNDSVNLDNKVKSDCEFAAQMVENINRLENSLSDAKTVQSNGMLDESEQILKQLEAPYMDEHMKSYDIDLNNFNETLASATEFYNSWIKMKEDIGMEQNRQQNMSNLISELRNFTTTARFNTVDAEKIIQKGLKDALLLAIKNIKSNSDQANERMENANRLLEESKENLNLLDNMQVDIKQQNDELTKETEKLKNKYNTIDQLSPYENLIESAEEHANKQMMQSKHLKELMSSAKNQATDPMKAANVYDNISSTVEQNELISKELLDNLEKIEKIKENLKDPVELSNKFQLVSERIANLAKKLNDQEKLINETEKINEDKLSQFGNLNQSLSNLDSMDDKMASHDNILKEVEKVNQIEDKANNISDLVDKLKFNTKDINDYSDFVNDVKEGKDYVDRFQKDVERIKNISASDNIDNLKNDFSKVQSQIENKIADLKKRIQLARHQANNMRVGVKFTDNSVLELNNPTNMVESSTYNKFSMQFQSNYPDGFLAYIGNPVENENEKVKRETNLEELSKTRRKTMNYDYMCLELNNGNVVLIWDLGSGHPTIIKDSQYIYDSRWHQIIVERFGRLIRLKVVTDKNVNTTTEKVATGSASVFNLDREQSKIYMGSLPDHVQLNSNIKNRKFYGVISNVMFDNEPLGLWNAKNSENIQGVPAFELLTENTLRFNGNSYVIMARNDLIFKDTVYVSFKFKTLNKNGLLFLVGDPMKKVFFSIELNDGNVAVKYDLGGGSTVVSSAEKYNDGEWHFIKVNREGKECLINVDNKDENSSFSLGFHSDLSTDDNIFIGGFRGINPYYEVTKEGFDGCIEDLQIDSSQQNLNNHKESFGVTVGCSTFVRIVSFSEQARGYVIFENLTIETDTKKLDGMFQITFKFRTLSKTGLLLYLTNRELDHNIAIYLSFGTLVIQMDNTQILQTDNQYYNDNKWHYITIDLNKSILEMNVDDKNTFSNVIDTKGSIQNNQLNTVYVGGVPFDSNLPNEFIGCIGDIALNFDFLNFAESSSTMNLNAQFRKCPLAANEDEFLLPNYKDLIVPETYTKAPSVENLPPIGDCKLPPIPQYTSVNYDSEEKRFGDTLWSRYEFAISNDVAKGLENESGFQLKFKTSQPEGILFYITSSNNIDFVGLYFFDSKLHYSFDCGSGRGVVVSQQVLNDDKWHTVTFSRKGKNGLLRVDEEVLEVLSIGSTSSLNVKSPIYVGGVPKELRSQIKGHLKSNDKNDYNYAMASFSGCIKDLKVRELEYKFKDGREFDVGPCMDQTEYGHFFHYDGGYIRLFDEFRVRVEFTLILEIKPRKPDGILAAVFGKIDYLVLYLDKGKLFFSVDNGAVPITASDERKNGLCDGNWHTIKAIKTKNLVMLNVDDNPPTIATGQAGISSTDTKDPLYIGGLPENIKEEKNIQLNNVKDNYLGCLRVKSINGAAQTLNNAKIEGHVTLNSCPLI